MPAKSKSQQRLMGMVHAYKNGKLKHAPKKIRDVAEHISDEDARDFAKTRHDGLEEKKAFDVAGIIAKLEKMAAGTKVAVYERDDSDPTEFDSLTEAAAFIAQHGAIPLSKVEKMLSQRQKTINGLRIEYPSAEESGSGDGVQDLARMFRGLTGSYGASSYGM